MQWNHRIKPAHSIGATAVALGALAVMVTACGTASRGTQTSSAPSPFLSEQAPGFNPVQDDATGYDGARWGISPADFSSRTTGVSLLRNSTGNWPCFGWDIAEPLASAVFDVPYRLQYNDSEELDPSTGTLREPGQAIVGRDINWAIFPSRKFQCQTKGDTEFVFYESKLAMTDRPAKMPDDSPQETDTDYEAMLSDLKSKFTEVSELARLPSVDVFRIHDVALFKRGKTNTRIYLFKVLYPSGLAVNALVYIPDFYRTEVVAATRLAVKQASAVATAGDARRQAGRLKAVQ